MHRFPRLTLALLALVVLLAACSSTTLSGSWKNPDYRGQIHKVYIVGIAKNELNRRIFEDEFRQQLLTQGVTGIASYKDLSSPADADQKTVAERIRANGADSVLMTRLVGKRVEEVVSPGRVSGYSSGPYGYSPSPYYRNMGSYYDRRFEATYEPATVTQFEIATIEANLYDAKSGELIWSAQLETVIEANLQKLMADFVKTVTEDLRQQGLL
jgi:hypothetical protein